MLHCYRCVCLAISVIVDSCKNVYESWDLNRIEGGAANASRLKALSDFSKMCEVIKNGFPYFQQAFIKGSIKQFLPHSKLDKDMLESILNYS